MSVAKLAHRAEFRAFHDGCLSKHGELGQTKVSQCAVLVFSSSSCGKNAFGAVNML